MTTKHRRRTAHLPDRDLLAGVIVGAVHKLDDEPDVRERLAAALQDTQALAAALAALALDGYLHREHGRCLLDERAGKPEAA